MNKRNIAIASLVAAVLGSGAVYAGSGYCEHKSGGHGYHQSHGGKHGGKHGGHHMGRMLKKLDGELALTEEQSAALKQIFEARRENRGDKRSERRELMSRGFDLDPTADNYDAQVAEIAEEVAEMARQRTLEMGELRKQVAEVLTPEQRSELRAMMEKRKERRGKHGGWNDA